MNEGVKGRPQHPPAAGTQHSRRGWRVFMAAFAALILVQSITITFPIRARVVNERTGEPLADTEAVAVWELIRATPAGALPGPVLRVERLKSNHDGQLWIRPALMVHPPLLPLSWLMRRHVPIIYVAAEGFYPRGAMNDVFSIERRKPLSFLFLQRSSLNGDSIRMEPKLAADVESGREVEDDNSTMVIIGNIERALASCGASWLCQVR